MVLCWLVFPGPPISKFQISFPGLGWVKVGDSGIQCMPDQRCAISTGNYGFFHILSSQGCVDSKLCGSHKGTTYTVSYSCCDQPHCNSSQRMGGATRFHYTLHK
uniref:UPAR/Ly6 domain-containing protein n=1 Tax=Haplochromis burtoni TaxID=8153 RepID=A0A3Q2UYB1_HAPBU